MSAALKLRAVGPPRPPMPLPPTRTFSFTDFQVNNPTAPPPGNQLDSNFDNTNTTISQTLAWVQTSLNTDGTLGTGTVGVQQLIPGLFDNIAEDAIAQVQPLVDQAGAFATGASASASAAAGSETNAIGAAAIASGAANGATASAAAANTSATTALTYRNNAQTFSVLASNSANAAAGSQNVCTNYGVLTQAWAEHMPDTIPPNILAWMGVTGDHWSSRWWANRAHELVEEGVCDLQQYWMGAYTYNPTVDNCGRPVVAGAAYFNLAVLRTRVYDGAIWHDLVEPVPGDIETYVYLPVAPTVVFTGPDRTNKTLILDPANDQAVVHLNGVKLIENLDYTLGTNQVTLSLAAVGAPNVIDIAVIYEHRSAIPPAGNKADTTTWVFDGRTTTFLLEDGAGNALSPVGAADCIVSLDGVIQDPFVDYTTVNDTIVFTVPPTFDQSIWVVVGIPLGGAGGGSGTIVYSPIAPLNPVNAMLWATPSATMFIYDGALQVWIQLVGQSN